jgi:hypothetical protein
MVETTSARASNLSALPEVRWLVVLVAVESLAVVGYFSLTSSTVTGVRYLVYPFVWINVGVLAVVTTPSPSGDRRMRLLAAAASALYFLALAGLSGLLAVELGSHSHAAVRGLQLTMSVPGWGPRVGYAGSLVTATFVPYRVVGYLALSYLVYATLLDAAGRAVSGVLGFASCVSCGLPVVGSLAAGAVGTMGGVAVATYAVDLSTLVFVGAVGLLALRPGRDP